VDEELRRELLARRAEDQRIRTLVTPPKGEHSIRLPDDVAAEWHRIDSDNTRWLAETLTARGWPGRALAGEDGAGAAWLLAQHADADPVRQREFLAALRDAVDRGDASPGHLAYLEDRVRVHAGQPQLYGTQFTVTDGEFGPCPIEDPERLDERRAAAGLAPFADYEARMRARLSVTAGLRLVSACREQPSAGGTMSRTRIPKAELTGVYGTIVERMSVKMLGEVAEPVEVAWHHRKVLNFSFSVARQVKKWNKCDANLKTFAHMAVASMVGCSFCLDLGYFSARNEGLDVTKAREVPRWRESDVFTPLERDVMEYAEAMTVTPPAVTDELSARLLAALGPAACGLEPLAVPSTV